MTVFEADIIKEAARRNANGERVDLCYAWAKRERSMGISDYSEQGMRDYDAFIDALCEALDY